MYLESKVRIDDINTDMKLCRQKSKETGQCYVQLVTTKDEINEAKRKAKTKKISIGKICPENPDMMHPNVKFFELFPDVKVEDDKASLPVPAFIFSGEGMSVNQLEEKAWEAIEFSCKGMSLENAREAFERRYKYLSDLFEELERLQKQEMLEAVLKSGKTYKEIMAFIAS